MKLTEQEMMHALSIIKLLYILIILSTLYTLKIFLHPEGAYELLVAPHQMGFYLENIFWSFMIIIGGSLLVKRVI